MSSRPPRRVESRRSLVALASFLLGIVSLVPIADGMLIFAIPAIVTGVIAGAQETSSLSPTSRLAHRGVVLGTTAISFVVLFWGLTFLGVASFGLSRAGLSEYFPVISSLLQGQWR